MQMAQNTESATTQLCKNNFLFIYHGACPLVQAFRPIPTKPTLPDPAAMQIRGAKEWPPSLSPNPKTRPQKKKRAKKGGGRGGEEKTFLLHFRNCHTSVWVGGDRRKLFTTPWSLPLSFPACKSLFLLFLDHVSDRERGRKRREEEGGGWKLGIKEGGGGFASGAAMAGKGSPLDTDSPINSYKKMKEKLPIEKRWYLLMTGGYLKAKCYLANF